jgi:hypothetical protein
MDDRPEDSAGGSLNRSGDLEIWRSGDLKR